MDQIVNSSLRPRGVLIKVGKKRKIGRSDYCEFNYTNSIYGHIRSDQFVTVRDMHRLLNFPKFSKEAGFVSIVGSNEIPNLRIYKDERLVEQIESISRSDEAVVFFLDSENTKLTGATKVSFFKRDQNNVKINALRTGYISGSIDDAKFYNGEYWAHKFWTRQFLQKDGSILNIGIFSKEFYNKIYNNYLGLSGISEEIEKNFNKFREELTSYMSKCGLSLSVAIEPKFEVSLNKSIVKGFIEGGAEVKYDLFDGAKKYVIATGKDSLEEKYIYRNKDYERKREFQSMFYVLMNCLKNEDYEIANTKFEIVPSLSQKSSGLYKFTGKEVYTLIDGLPFMEVHKENKSVIKFFKKIVLKTPINSQFRYKPLLFFRRSNSNCNHHYAVHREIENLFFDTTNDGIYTDRHNVNFLSFMIFMENFIEWERKNPFKKKQRVLSC